MTNTLKLALAALLLASSLHAQNANPAGAAPNRNAVDANLNPIPWPNSVPQPTLSNVAYGKHRKQVLYFWKAESAQPTPLLFFIHGGGWQNGNRLSGLAPMVPEFLKTGVSVVSVEYRFINEATADGEVPPVRGPLHDAARALQFVRSKAAEWNIDKTRIGASPLSRLPFCQPPPWMKNSSGVGRADSAFQK